MTAGKLFTKTDEVFDCLQGNNAPFIGLVTYGNTYYGIALTEMLRRAEKQGFVVTALGAFIARHSIDPNFAAGRPDDKDKEIIRDFAHKVYEKVLSGDLTLHMLPKTN